MIARIITYFSLVFSFYLVVLIFIKLSFNVKFDKILSYNGYGINISDPNGLSLQAFYALWIFIVSSICLFYSVKNRKLMREGPHVRKAQVRSPAGFSQGNP